MLFKIFYNFIYLNSPIQFFKKNENPCIKCGACCSFFKINVPEKDLINKNNQGFIPADFVIKKNKIYYMKNTSILGNRCEKLVGDIGSNTQCNIYLNRPSPCREFPVFINGEQNYRCKRARAYHNLPPNIKFVD
mgnify:CR=1 FL=1